MKGFVVIIFISTRVINFLIIFTKIKKTNTDILFKREIVNKIA